MSKILLENKKPGTTDWKLNNPAINREIEGYASQSSINAGETIDFFVSTTSKKYYFTLFRMGWYAGTGARQLMKSETLAGCQQTIPLPDKESGMVECDWTSSYTLQTNENWTSGVYVSKLEELDSGKQSYIIFVLRNDNYSPEIIFPLAFTTYQAYNFWGGKNLYDFGSGSDHDWGSVSGKPATKISFNRPYVRSNNPKAAYGMGAGDFFTNTRPVTTHKYPISSAGWDYNMVRWLEKNGYDVNYSTSIDTHHRKELLNNTKVLITNGHDEYWTHEMRENVTAARDNGINLSFFSSNTMFWQIRLEHGNFDKKENRIIVSYKDANADVVKGKKSTINFRDVPEQGSEASLIGINYILDPVFNHINITNAAHWVFENTGLKNGDKLKGLLGFEVDALADNSPSNIVTLAASTCQNRDKDDYIGIIKYMLSKVFKLSVQPLEKKFNTSKTTKVSLISMLVLLGLLCVWLVFIKLGTAILLGISLLILLPFIFWFIKIANSEIVTSHMTIYEADSKAQVFATGSMQWVWGLDDFNAPELRKSYHNNVVEITTHTVLKRFGAFPHALKN